MRMRSIYSRLSLGLLASLILFQTFHIYTARGRRAIVVEGVYEPVKDFAFLFGVTPLKGLYNRLALLLQQRSTCAPGYDVNIYFVNHQLHVFFAIPPDTPAAVSEQIFEDLNHSINQYFINYSLNFGSVPGMPNDCKSFLMLGTLRSDPAVHLVGWTSRTTSWFSLIDGLSLVTLSAALIIGWKQKEDLFRKSP